MHSILVIGDTCTDIHCYGKLTKKSPEGKGMVFLQKEFTENLGMALNVFENVKAMGDNHVSFYVDQGDITKTRYIDSDTNELYLRVDKNDTTEELDLLELTDFIDITSYDAIILSDYSKGFLTEETIEYIADRHDCVILDTKKRLGPWCKNVKFIKLNIHEYQNNLDIIKRYPWLEEKLIITLDKYGAMYMEEHFPTENVKDPDVSGAGDTFVAAFTVEYLNTSDIRGSIIVANKRATDVVKHRGVTIWNKDM